tara:strand:- start:177 stop:581 length:405 start_codon:yes stop_codon:yes gene_type:complete
VLKDTTFTALRGTSPAGRFEHVHHHLFTGLVRVDAIVGGSKHIHPQSTWHHRKILVGLGLFQVVCHPMQGDEDVWGRHVVYSSIKEKMGGWGVQFLCFYVFMFLCFMFLSFLSFYLFYFIFLFCVLLSVVYPTD